jgi:hypothetical protein
VKTRTTGRAPRGNGRTLWLIVLGTALVTSAGLFHVYSVQKTLAIRRAIWLELAEAQTLDAQRTEMRREQARMTAVPREAVKAQVMGLRQPRADQVIELDIQEAVP